MVEKIPSHGYSFVLLGVLSSTCTALPLQKLNGEVFSKQVREVFECF